MNNKKIIGYLMMQTLEAVWKAEDNLKKCMEEFEIEDETEYLKVIEVCLKNIRYYAKMIIEKDGAL